MSSPPQIYIETLHWECKLLVHQIKCIMLTYKRIGGELGDEDEDDDMDDEDEEDDMVSSSRHTR